ncbi:hypothetical protein ACFSC4_22610 [Deinococcus malanensis]|uniref:hypothetical protein n=1 Tax=Deinococcus malanensis TaxID=1706855 RepID=UPI0016643302|nr:hypothetical protein [Deinococcus malanensis]
MSRTQGWWGMLIAGALIGVGLSLAEEMLALAALLALLIGLGVLSWIRSEQP